MSCTAVSSMAVVIVVLVGFPLGTAVTNSNTRLARHTFGAAHRNMAGSTSCLQAFQYRWACYDAGQMVMFSYLLSLFMLFCFARLHTFPFYYLYYRVVFCYLLYHFVFAFYFATRWLAVWLPLASCTRCGKLVTLPG